MMNRHEGATSSLAERMLAAIRRRPLKAAPDSPTRDAVQPLTPERNEPTYSHLHITDAESEFFVKRTDSPFIAIYSTIKEEGKLFLVNASRKKISYEYDTIDVYRALEDGRTSTVLGIFGTRDGIQYLLKPPTNKHERFSSVSASTTFSEELGGVLITTHGAVKFLTDQDGNSLSKKYHTIDKKDGVLYGCIGAIEEEIHPSLQEGIEESQHDYDYDYDAYETYGPIRAMSEDDAFSVARDIREPFWERDRALGKLPGRQAAFWATNDPTLPFWVRDRHALRGGRQIQRRRGKNFPRGRN